jgi:hypothetical protein
LGCAIIIPVSAAAFDRDIAAQSLARTVCEFGAEQNAANHQVGIMHRFVYCVTCCSPPATKSRPPLVGARLLKQCDRN